MGRVSTVQNDEPFSQIRGAICWFDHDGVGLVFDVLMHFLLRPPVGDYSLCCGWRETYDGDVGGGFQKGVLAEDLGSVGARFCVTGDKFQPRAKAF